jgi:sec-independent protein translocase protein TatC
MIPLSDHLTFKDHFLELKKRLIYALLAWLMGFAVCYFFKESLYQFLLHPLADASKGEFTRRLIYTHLPEAFLIYVKLGLYGGFCLASPFIFAQLWLFIAPGLYAHEKKVFLPFLLATPLLFLCGAALAYYFVFPLAWEFFLSFELPHKQGQMPIQLEAKMSDYLSLSTQIIMAFGFCFELPVLLTLLAKIGLVTSESLKKKRKYMFVLAFVVGAVLTPPDLLSQVALAIPLYALYEISILTSKLVQPKEEDLEHSPY